MNIYPDFDSLSGITDPATIAGALLTFVIHRRRPHADRLRHRMGHGHSPRQLHHRQQGPNRNPRRPRRGDPRRRRSRLAQLASGPRSYYFLVYSQFLLVAAVAAGNASPQNPVSSIDQRGKRNRSVASTAIPMSFPRPSMTPTRNDLMDSSPISLRSFRA